MSEGPRKRGLIPRRDKSFFFLAAQTGSVTEQTSYSVDTGGEAMPRRSGALVSIDAEEYVELTSTPLCAFMAWRLIKYLNNLTLRLPWSRILLDHDITTFIETEDSLRLRFL